VNLDQLLGRLTVDQLQDLLVLWAPDRRMSNSKMELFRSLRSEMTRPERARHCLEVADALGRGMVCKLLRSEGVSQSVAVLAASSAARPKSVQDARAVVTDLAGMGLVSVEPEKRWETYGSARVTIPDELVEPLRRATGIDDRAWQEILHLADFLARGSIEDRAAALREAGVELDPNAEPDALADALAERDAVADRIAALPEPLPEVVRAVLEKHAGLVPTDRLGDLGPEMPDPDEATLNDWRRALEAQLIGTIGDVSLLDFGIDLDGRVLAVFTEVAQAAWFRPIFPAEPPPDPVGPDFLLDLAELMAVIRETGAKLKASGALTAASADRIIGRLHRPELPVMDAYWLLEFRLACAERLGLVERSGKSLELGPKTWDWERRSFQEKSAGLFDLMGFAAPQPQSKHHHGGLCAAARAVLRDMPPGAWWAGGAVEGAGLRRYLSDLERTNLRDRITAAVHQVEEFVLPPFPRLRQLRATVREAVVKQAYAMGILDVGFDRERITAERLSDFGAVAARGRSAEKGPGKLIPMADFEVIILPEGDATRLRYDVGQFAAREKFEQTYHLRIIKERVEEAVVRGLSADDMVGVLERHSETGTVPQNVVASIRGWAERVRTATIEHAVVFELQDEALLDVVAELPGMKERTVRRLSPTALALRAWPSDRRLLAELRKLGVHVR
jgi:hypothetical protein